MKLKTLFVIFFVANVFSFELRAQIQTPPQTPPQAPPASGGAMKPLLSGRTPIPPVTTLEKIKKLIDKSTNMGTFLESMYAFVLPGDEILLRDIIRKHPSLAIVRPLPTFNYDKGMFFVHDTSGEITFRRKGEESYEFDVDGSSLDFDPAYSSYIRWKKIMDIKLNTSAFRISFMPSAFAAEHEGEPTALKLMMFVSLSRFLRSSVPLKAAYKSTKYEVPYADVWKKIKGERKDVRLCTSELLLQAAQKIAEINVSSLSCNSGNLNFKLAYNTSEARDYNLNVGGRSMEMVASEKLKYTFVRSHAMSELKRQNHSNKKKHVTLEIPIDADRVERMKGFAWLPKNSHDEELMAAGEHVRELINFVVSTNFCGLCERYMKIATKNLIDSGYGTGAEENEAKSREGKTSGMTQQAKPAFPQSNEQPPQSSMQPQSQQSSAQPTSPQVPTFLPPQAMPDQQQMTSPPSQPSSLPPAGQQEMSAPGMMPLPPDVK